MEQGTGFDSNGKRQTARLPFASNSSPNNSQPVSSQPFSQNPVSNQPFSQNKDVYATRIGDDFDDVLDVPVQSQSNYQTAEEAVPVFEDVFTAQSQDQTSVYDFASYEKTSTTPIDTFRTSAARQRETADYTEPAEQEFMGWPVLPEDSGDDEEAVRSSRGGLFARVGLIVGVFGVLCFLAYYFLGDFIARRKGQEQNLASANSQSGNPTTNPSVPVQSSPQTAAPSGQTDGAGAQPLVVTPKPPDTAPPQGAKPKEGQVVSIPPVTNPDGTVGRIGRADPPTAAPPIEKPPVAPNKGNLTIQVGSFKDQAEADARAARLNSATGGDVFRVFKADIPGIGTWYRVKQVSGFVTREAAMSYGNQLRSKNVISDFIVTTK